MSRPRSAGSLRSGSGGSSRPTTGAPPPRGGAVLGREVGGEPEPAARPRLHVIAAGGLAGDVVCDPEEPRERRAGGLVAEAPAREPRLGERLRGQVARRPLEAATEPRVHH